MGCTLLDKIMLAGIAQFAGVIALDMFILVTTITFFPGTAGGGDALLMVLLPMLSYSLACLILVPSLLYRLYLRLCGQIRINGKDALLTWAGLCVVALPPIVINLLPFFRWMRRTI